MRDFQGVGCFFTKTALMMIWRVETWRLSAVCDLNEERQGLANLRRTARDLRVLYVGPSTGFLRRLPVKQLIPPPTLRSSTQCIRAYQRFLSFVLLSFSPPSPVAALSRPLP
eukprot:745685-Hanusia_phi.AAC.1